MVISNPLGRFNLSIFVANILEIVKNKKINNVFFLIMNCYALVITYNVLGYYYKISI